MTPKELFQNYKQADEQVKAARAALDEAMALRSVKVQAIVTQLGKGPFQFDGKSIQAVKRATKDENDQVTGQTWFFKSIGQEVQIIE